MLLVIMLDALNHRYLSIGAPFFDEIRSDGLAVTVIPPFGFEPDAAYVAGLSPAASNGGTHFWRDPERSVFRWTKHWGRPMANLGSSADRFARLGIRAVNRFAARTRGRRMNGRPENIPLEQLHLFDVVHSRLMFEPGFTDSPTVFDLVRDRGGSFKYLGPPVHRGGGEALARRLESMDVRDLDLLFVMIGDLDRVGHQYGPMSKELEAEWRRIDRVVERMYRHCQAQTDHVTLMVFGDHGMVNVTGTVHMEEVLSRVGAKRWEDYDYFLDSTFARFWTKDPRTRRTLEKHLSDVEGGSLLNEVDYRDYEIEYNHDRFGELIFWASGGNIVFPNFFQTAQIPNGMHGYRREVTDNHSALLLLDPNRTYSISNVSHREMVDIFATMIDALDTEMPGQAAGASLFA